MEFALKHIFARDILPHVKDIAGLLQELAQADGRDYVEIVLQYFLERGELSDKESFFSLIHNEISREVGEDIMSLAEELRQEGRQEGWQELIIKMLDNGVEPAFIAKNTGIPLYKVKEIEEGNKH